MKHCPRMTTVETGKSAAAPGRSAVKDWLAVRPVLQGDGIGDSSVGVLLLTFGAAGVCGNFIAGALVARRLRRCVVGISVVLASAMTLLALVDTDAFSAGALLVLWGLGYGAVPVTFQTWILDAAPDATEAATSLYVSAFNLSIALGPSSAGSPSTASARRACCGPAPAWPSWPCWW